MGWLTVLVWVSGLFGWFGIGFGLMYSINQRFPAEFDRFVGSTAPGEVLCLLVWPWTLAVVLTLAWLHRDDRYQDEHTLY